MVDEIATCCGKDSFVPGISSEYEKIGKEIIFSLLNDHYNNLFMTGLNKSRRLHVIKIAMQSFKSRLNVDDIEFDKLSKMYSQSKIFIAACAGVETNDPWKLEKENIPCPEKQIHEGYKNQEWYFYKGSARKQKYSNYAFRTPSECFAEMYACYFLTNGKKLPKDHRDWFEANIPEAKETFERQKLEDKHKFQVSQGHYYKRNLI